MKILFMTFFFAFCVLGCTLYESEGRKCIRHNCGNLNIELLSTNCSPLSSSAESYQWTVSIDEHSFYGLSADGYSVVRSDRANRCFLQEADLQNLEARLPEHLETLSVWLEYLKSQAPQE